MNISLPQLDLQVVVGVDMFIDLKSTKSLKIL